MFATQRPCHAAVARLSEKHSAFPATGDHMNDVDSINWHIFSFEVDWMGFASMSVLNNVSVSEVDAFMHVEHVGGNVVLLRHATCAAAHLRCQLAQKSQAGGRQPMRELPWAEQLVQEMQRHRGAPEVELSGEECADGDDNDVGTLVVVKCTWAELQEIRRK